MAQLDTCLILLLFRNRNHRSVVIQMVWQTRSIDVWDASQEKGRKSIRVKTKDGKDVKHYGDYYSRTYEIVNRLAHHTYILSLETRLQPTFQATFSRLYNSRSINVAHDFGIVFTVRLWRCCSIRLIGFCQQKPWEWNRQSYRKSKDMRPVHERVLVPLCNKGTVPVRRFVLLVCKYRQLRNSCPFSGKHPLLGWLPHQKVRKSPKPLDSHRTS